MASQYEQPQSGSQVASELEANPSISPGTFNAMSNILGLENPGSQVNVASWSGPAGPVVAPPGLPALLIFTSVGQFEPIIITEIPSELRQTPVWVFDSDVGITVTFNTVERVIQMGNGDDVVTVNGDRNTTIDGSAGNDRLTLSGGDDSITGGTGNDTIGAGAGDDTIVGVYGLDSVDGGIGFDVIQAQGAVTDWIVVAEGSVVSLSGAPGSSDGVEMRNVNFIQFATATQGENGDQFSIVVTDEANDKAAAMRLYQAALDRSADQGGAQYWLDQVGSGVNYSVVAGSFLGSAEYAAKYGAQTNAQFVEQLYQNTFDRSAEQGGLDFWVGLLNSGVSRADVLSAIAGSGEAAQTVTNVVVVTSIV